MIESSGGSSPDHAVHIVTRNNKVSSYFQDGNSLRELQVRQSPIDEFSKPYFRGLGFGEEDLLSGIVRVDGAARSDLEHGHTGVVGTDVDEVVYVSGKGKIVEEIREPERTVIPDETFEAMQMLEPEQREPMIDILFAPRYKRAGYEERSGLTPRQEEAVRHFKDRTTPQG